MDVIFAPKMFFSKTERRLEEEKKRKRKSHNIKRRKDEDARITEEKL